ncbi:MAG: hypothetical protein QHH27_07685 [Clostridia bacterium]|jgi:hypothetical protein|nr:hypothetical protein [Clostridia bacterium]MDH7573409.1 hypothetical protein [Clostridia bacterium]
MACGMRPLVAVLLVAGLLWPGSTAARSEPSARALVVLTEGLTLEELLVYGGPQAEALVRRGALGLMNLSGAHRSPIQAATLLGAGEVLRIDGEEATAFDVSEVEEGEKAGVTWARRTGLPVPETGAVVPGWPALLAAAEKQGAIVGRLGAEIRRSGRTAAAFGNGDTEKEYFRPAALVAADEWGRVQFGAVGSGTLKYGRDGLLGRMTDETLLLECISRLPPGVALVVVDTGDGHRIEANRSRALPEVVRREKLRFTSRLVALVEELEEHSPENTRIFLVGLGPGGEALTENNLLVPVLMLGEGVKQGWLSSPTTRRPGLISAVDFCPTLLDVLGMPVPPDLPGRPWRVVPARGGPEELVTLNRELAMVRTARPILVRAYIALLMVVMGLAVVAFLGPGRTKVWSRRVLPGALLFLAAVPLAFLLLASVRTPSLPAYAGLLVTLAVLITLGCTRLGRDRRQAWLFLGTAVVATLTVDTLMGAPWQQKALLSYDLMSGARYYGIGNEYMGVLVGSALLAGGVLLEGGREAWRTGFAGLIWTTVLSLLASPAHGANAGGMITAACAFGTAAVLLARARPAWRTVLWVGLITVAVSATAVWWDGAQSVAAQSHFGRALDLVRQQGWPALQEMVARKLSTSLRLIRYTIWTRALLAGMVVLAVLFYHPVGKLDRFRSALPRLSRCLGAMVLASFVALIFNDSGIVAAATMMIYGIGPLLSLILDERTLLTKDPPGVKMGVD